MLSGLVYELLNHFEFTISKQLADTCIIISNLVLLNLKNCLVLLFYFEHINSYLKGLEFSQYMKLSLVQVVGPPSTQNTDP